MKNKNYSFNLSYIDLLWNIIICITMLLLLALSSVNPKDKNNKNAEDPSQYFIILTWPDESASDLDLLLLSPDNSIISYKNRDLPYASLERDDRGIYNDMMDLGEYGRKPILLNREVIRLKGTFDGKYVVNVLLYSKSDNHYLDKPELESIPVRVELQQINPKFNSIIIKDITINVNKEEKTAFSFYRNGDKIDDVSYDQIIIGVKSN